MPASSPQVTRLLARWSDGSREALDELMPLVHAELRRLARGYMRREHPHHTLQATALVNEAFLRLVDQSEVKWANRAHFFGIAAQMMRRILVDHARRRRARKRGGEAPRVSLHETAGVDAVQGLDLLHLNDALTELAKVHPTQARIVELKFFGGMTVDEIAEVLELSPASVKRGWSFARAWLRRELGPPIHPARRGH